MKTIAMALMFLLVQGQMAPHQSISLGDAEYVVGPSDVLELRVYGEDDLSRPVLPVDTDGTVEIPLLGRIKASGLTARQLQQDIQQRYVKGGFFSNPNVSVSVREFRSHYVWVLGQVNSPGQITLRGNLTLMKAIAEAGGFNRDAGTNIHLYHEFPGQMAAGPVITSERKPDVIVSRDDYEAGRLTHIRLRNGDTVVVMRAETFSVSGEVKAVGTYVLRPPRTVWQAVSVDAGGLAQRAAKGRIYILRWINGKQVKVDVDDIEKELVQPGDTIVVPSRRI